MEPDQGFNLKKNLAIEALLSQDFFTLFISLVEQYRPRLYATIVRMSPFCTSGGTTLNRNEPTATPFTPLAKVELEP